MIELQLKNDWLVSAYSYHSSSKYTGAYYKFSDILHEIRIEDCFYLFRDETKAIEPKVVYLNHKDSDNKVDVIIKLEELDKGLALVSERFTSLNFPIVEHENKSEISNYKSYYGNKCFLEDVVKYYKEDFTAFGYDLDVTK